MNKARSGLGCEENRPRACNKMSSSSRTGICSALIKEHDGSLRLDISRKLSSSVRGMGIVGEIPFMLRSWMARHFTQLLCLAEDCTFARGTKTGKTGSFFNLDKSSPERDL